MNDSQLIIIAKNEIIAVDGITSALLKLIDLEFENRWAVLFSIKDMNFYYIQSNKSFIHAIKDLNNAAVI